MQSTEQKFLTQIEAHKGVIFKISKMYIDHYDGQKDLFQEITYQAWKAFPNFRGESKFSTWLYRIAINTAIVYLKSESKRSIFSHAEVENIKIENEDYSDDEDVQLKKLYTAIHQLNTVDRALIFYFLENYSGKEMAAQLGISEGSCRVKLSRAKEKLKQIING